jgi:hypothetical protein
MADDSSKLIQDVTVGDQLDTGGNGTVTVRSSWRFTSSIRTYNLTVDGLHTYYVLAGSSPLLVHNCPDALPTGFSEDAVSSAFENMRNGGGHAMRYLIKDGTIPDKGSVASKAKIFQEKLTPILTNPTKTFDWKLGDTQSKVFAGEVEGRTIVAFVAKEGPYQGNVISAFEPSPANMVKWGLN